MIIFLLTALAIRLVGFTSSAIWYDEVHSLIRGTHPLIYFNMFEIFLRPFAHGPLWLLRLPALLFGIGSLWVAWLVMDELQFENDQRTTACIFLAAFPGLIWTSQDARYYSMIAFASIATIYLALKHRWTFGIAFGFLYFIHPTAPAYGLAAFAVAWFTQMDRRKWFMAVLAAPLVYVLMRIFITWFMRTIPFTAGYCCSGGRQVWYLGAMEPTYTAYSIVQAFFVNTLPPVLMLAALFWILYVLTRAAMRPLTIPAMITVIPFLAVLITSLIYLNVFYYRPLMALAVPLSLWIGFARERFMTGLGLILLLAGLAFYDPGGRGARLDISAARIREAWQAGDRITYEDGITAAPFDYYLSDLPACVLSVEYLPINSDLALCTSQATGREWLITSTIERDDALLFDHLWPWQVTPIKVYLVDK